MTEDKTDLFWCIVGDRVQTHFLYKNNLSNKEFKIICKEVRKDVYKT